MAFRRIVLACLPLLLFGTVTCRRGDATAENPVDRQSLQLLTGYLRINTSNPPGGETPGAEYLRAALVSEGIEASLVGADPARQSVYARLKSGTREPALLLLHHIDTVPANPAEWTVPPFEGRQTNGYVWGRGALDAKGLGVAHLQAFLDLKRSALRLKRDVVFLAVADEEAGGLAGAKELLAQRPELFDNVGFVLNEGGANETVVDRVSTWGIEVAQKIPLWVRVRVKGEGGHGASPPTGGGSAVKLIQLVQEIVSEPREKRIVPSVRRYFEAIRPNRLGKRKEILTSIDAWLQRPELETELPLSYRSLLSDTVAVTTLFAGDAINSIPATATATLDYRLLPDADPARELENLRRIVAGRADVEVILEATASPESPAEGVLFETLGRVLRDEQPSSLVVPMVTAGATDSRFFRERGIVAYGFSPFKLNYYDGDTIHGPDERIRTRFFLEGVHLMGRVVRAFAVAE